MNRCFACGLKSPSRKYLCNSCWLELPDVTRDRLEDAQASVTLARDRLFQLLSAIKRCVPLNRIEVVAA
jgi:hypothetical protein